MCKCEQVPEVPETEMKKMEILIPQGAKSFECPLCGRELKVPSCFTDCMCGQWMKTARSRTQTSGWGCGDNIEETYMVLQERVTQEAARLAFLGMLAEIHHERIALPLFKPGSDGER